LFEREHSVRCRVGWEMGTLRRDRGVVRRGRPGLAGSAPPDLSPGFFPAASGLSRIFVRIGNGLHGPTDTISSLEGQALWIVLLRNSNPPGIPSTPSTAAVMPQAVNGLRNYAEFRIMPSRR